MSPRKTVCAVQNCANNLGSVFHLPNPNKSWDLFVAWIAATGNPKFTNMDFEELKEMHKKVVVCEIHFTDEDLQQLRQKIKCCVPSKHLPEPIELNFGIETRETSALAVTLKENIPIAKRKLIDQEPSSSSKRILMESSNIESSLPSTSYGAQVEDIESSGSKSPSACSSISLSIPMLPVKKKNLSPKALQLFNQVQHLRRKARNLNRKNASLNKRMIQAKKVIDSQNLEKLTENLTPFQKRFFACQLKNARRPAKHRTYSLEDKLDSLLLWKSSPSTYRTLNRLGFTLPTSTTLQKLLRKIPMDAGLSHAVFESLGIKARSMSSKDRCCVLLFDEMAIQPHFDYDSSRDVVVGFGHDEDGKVADHATVFMLRGVFKKWKQPVGYFFHQSCMPAANIVKNVKEIMKYCENIGFNVIASVCDQGTNNVKSVRLLEEDTRREFLLKGEEPQRSIVKVSETEYVPLFDAPHLLKSLRNNLLVKDLKFCVNGVWKIASWSHIEQAYNIDRSNNIRVMKKIHDSHVVRDKVKKMKVSIAAQIFSATVASTIRYCALSGLKSVDGLSQLDEGSLDTAELLLMFDSLFDSVNSSSACCDGKGLKKIVSQKSAHTAEWLRALNTLKTMEFVKSKPSDRTRPPVLDGWEKTINGFIAIKKKLADLGYFKFSARNFNQDPLENFFSQMRQYGVRNTNPSCSLFSCFYKSLLVKNIHHHPKESNCEDDASGFASTLKELLSSDAPSPIQSDRWHVPETQHVDTQQIEIGALGYVAGFLVNELFQKIPNCDICRKNLLHNSDEPDEFHHSLIALKEYDVHIKKLTYSNVELIKKLIEIYNLLQIYLPTALNKNQLKERLISAIRCEVSFNFEECAHKEEIETYLFNQFTRTYIYNYIKTLNNILIGKHNPPNKNAIEESCYNLYRKRLHFKK